MTRASPGNCGAGLLQAMKHAGRALNADEYQNRPLRQRAMEYLAMALMRLALLVQGQKYL
jgi:cardiolipin synthase